MKLSDLFTDKQLIQITGFYNSDSTTARGKCLEEIIQPNIKTISKKAGQEMDATYLSYLLEGLFLL
jgi:hypothetical protein